MKPNDPPLRPWPSRSRIFDAKAWVFSERKRFASERYQAIFSKKIPEIIKFLMEFSQTQAMKPTPTSASSVKGWPMVVSSSKVVLTLFAMCANPSEQLLKRNLFVVESYQTSKKWKSARKLRCSIFHWAPKIVRTVYHTQKQPQTHVKAAKKPMLQNLPTNFFTLSNRVAPSSTTQIPPSQSSSSATHRGTRRIPR